MPQKTCPTCQNRVAVASKKCGCGYEFKKKVEKSEIEDDLRPEYDLSKLKPTGKHPKLPLEASIEKALKHPVPVDADLKGELPKTDLPKPPRPDPEPIPVMSGQRTVFTPTGDCPCKPAGFKEGWPDGPCSDEDVIEWALSVRDKGVGEGLVYLPEAVRYFIREFWDMNGPEYLRIRGLVGNALQREDYDTSLDLE